MAKKETANNVQEFVSIIENFSKGSSGKTLLFRGQTNEEYKLEPSLARKIQGTDLTYVYAELDMVTDAMSKRPEMFHEEKYPINLLVKLQHFGLPTRLLDVTYNALMGFKSEKEKDCGGKFNLAVTKWQNREREELKEIAKKYDIEIVNGNQSRQHLNREQYIIEKKKEELQRKENSINNCVSQIDDFIKNDDKGSAFYYSVELSKREKELEKLKKDFDDMAEQYRKIKEKGEVEVL